MNRISVLSITAVMALALTACGKPGSKPTTVEADHDKTVVTVPAEKPAGEPAAVETKPQAANESAVEGASEQVADNGQAVDGAAAQE